MTLQEIESTINDILENPCGRDTMHYGPSRTEKSIVKLCNIVLCLAQENDRLQKKINIITNIDHIVTPMKKVTILQLIQQIFPEIEGSLNSQDTIKRFTYLIDDKIRAVLMSDDTNLTVNYNGEERIMRDADNIEYIGEVGDKGHRFRLRGYLDDWTQYEVCFTIYPTDQFVQ